MRVMFTGGSGKAGRVVVPYLMEQGHRVLNVDKVPLDIPGSGQPDRRHHRQRTDVQRVVRLRRIR